MATDAGYGNTVDFRVGLVERQLHYAVGIERSTAVWPEPITLAPHQYRGVGRPRKKRADLPRPVSVLELSRSLPALVRLVKIRWWIKQGYQQLKGELGLDYYEGRSWQGWHHHVTLTMVAFAFLVLEMLRLKKTAGPSMRLPRIRRGLQPMLALWTGTCA